jgi:hypothetical protein
LVQKEKNASCVIFIQNSVAVAKFPNPTICSFFPMNKVPWNKAEISRTINELKRIEMNCNDNHGNILKLANDAPYMNNPASSFQRFHRSEMISLR